VNGGGAGAGNRSDGEVAERLVAVPIAGATGRESAPAVVAQRRRYPPRPAQSSWQYTEHSAQQVLARLGALPFRAGNLKTQEYRMRGADKLLRWLAAFPGDCWQERWQASGQEDSCGSDWARGPADWLTLQGESAHPGVLSSGMLMLLCSDAIRPSVPWLVGRRSRQLTDGMAQYRDADGFAALDRVIAADPGIIMANAQPAKARIAVILAAKGGRLDQITVGDCVEFYDVHTRIRPRGGPGKTLFYLLLHRLGIFDAGAPATLRALCGPAAGQLSDTGLVERYGLQTGPIRDLIIDYLGERRPAIDYSTLTNLAQVLAGLFWADLERFHPGIDSLHLAPAIAAEWKERLKTKTRTVTHPLTGRRSTTISERHNTAGALATVRAFYLDIAQWALEEPARWGPWAAPCPIKDTELTVRKEKQAVKARMDQRTRTRLPVVPALARAADTARKTTAERLATASRTEPGQMFTCGDQILLRPLMYRQTNANVWAQEPATGTRRNLTLEESDAFWAWAAIEVLTRTGIRIEELLELTHQAVSSYRLPTTGELVPLLQIAPSKTDAERLVLVEPELADVLSAIICRIRAPNGAVPLVPAYDYSEKIWIAPMGLLFQRTIGGQKHAFHPRAVYQVLSRALGASGLTDTDGHPLHFTPHDFRRIFVTDAILGGLPPHIAQIICGHADISTTLGYKAVYPTEAIDAHRAFIARRRSTRPGEEYRTPTDEEWDAFLAHFERRKVSLGTCARPFNTPCIHEHACVRCPLLRPEPTQRPRLEEIRANLDARIAEAQREGWLGEIEGLHVSLTGAHNKLAQLDATAHRHATSINLPTPTFAHIAGRTGNASPAATPTTP